MLKLFINLYSQFCYGPVRLKIGIARKIVVTLSLFEVFKNSATSIDANARSWMDIFVAVLEQLIVARLFYKLSMLHRSWGFLTSLTIAWHTNLCRTTSIKLTSSHPVPFFEAILIPAYEGWIGVRFPPRARDSSCHQSTKISSESHSASFALVIRTSFFASRVAMTWSWLVRHHLMQIWRTCGVKPPFPHTPSRQAA